MSEKVVRIGSRLTADEDQASGVWFICTTARIEVGELDRDECLRQYVFTPYGDIFCLTIEDLRALARFMVKLEKGTVTPMEEEDE